MHSSVGSLMCIDFKKKIGAFTFIYNYMLEFCAIYVSTYIQAHIHTQS